MGRADEKTRKIATAKGEIGYRSSGKNFSQERAFGVDAVNAIAVIASNRDPLSLPIATPSRGEESGDMSARQS
jgi:hypothetical protein